jgi:hypothetical protein
MGRLPTCLPRLSLAQLRTLPSITVGTCHKDLANFPSPRWENALLTCPIRFSSFMSGAALIYHSLEYVLSAPETLKAPIAPMGKLLTCLPRLMLAQLRPTLRSTTVCTCRRDLNFSHRPNGRLTFCSLFAGRRCLRLGRHGHDNVFLDPREYSLHCVCSCSKVPNAPMGELLTRLPRLTLAQLRTLRSTTDVCTCRIP